MEIPSWLQEHINTACPYCKEPIVNNFMLTDRYCSNLRCPEHMAQKIVVLAKRFGVKNFGIAAARSVVRQNKFQLHTQIIPYWFKDKPLLHLHEIGEICLIKGHQKKWREYCEGRDNMLQVLKDPSIPLEIKAHPTLLLYTEAVCRVKPRLLGARINVMLSGSFEGYRARADFITEMNMLFGDIIQLVDVGKRKTQVAYLIKEAYTTDHEKSAIAQATGVPIVTPEEMKQKLAAYRTYIIERRESP